MLVIRIDATLQCNLPLIQKFSMSPGRIRLHELFKFPHHTISIHEHYMYKILLFNELGEFYKTKNVKQGTIDILCNEI